jgi:hypothetical protein
MNQKLSAASMLSIFFYLSGFVCFTLSGVVAGGFFFSRTWLPDSTQGTNAQVRIESRHRRPFCLALIALHFDLWTFGVSVTFLALPLCFQMLAARATYGLSAGLRMPMNAQSFADYNFSTPNVCPAASSSPCDTSLTPYLAGT